MKKNVCYGIIIEDTFSIYSMQLSQVPKHSIMNIQKQIVCIMIALGTIVALWILEYILTAKSLDRKTEYMIVFQFDGIRKPKQNDVDIREFSALISEIQFY